MPRTGPPHLAGSARAVTRRAVPPAVAHVLAPLIALAATDPGTARASSLGGRVSPAGTGPLARPVGGATIDELPPLGEFLATLRPERPRLVLTPARVAALRALGATDATARSHVARLAQVGQRLLDLPVSTRMAGATRTTPGARRLLDRLATLALLHLLDGDARWSTRAIAEMRALAAADWNPGYFLDVAEATATMAIGYDWVHAALDADTRRVVREAIVEKGLRAFDAALRQPAPWVTAGNDWTAACNAAAIVGALAVADDEPDLAYEVASRAVGGLPVAVASYGSDGAWPDGPAYWDAATGALAIAAASLESATGSDQRLCASAGLVAGPAYRLHVTGSTGLAFNYGDSADRLEIDPAVEWLGQRAGDAWIVAEARTHVGPTIRPFAVAWYRAFDAPAVAPPLDRWFADAGVVCMRGAWNDPAAIYCAAKGGDNASRHAHLDLGTFVLDALGERWAIDLGPDDYALPEYFGRKRHAYYRTRTEGHNTLVIDGQNQDPGARAPVVSFGAHAGEARAVIDLGHAYAAAGATRVRRGIGLVDGRRRVIVQDEVSVRPGTDVAWAMHTQAEVQVDLAAGGRVAMLNRGNARVEARIISPDVAWFAVEVVAAPAPQRRIDGVRKLTVQAPPVAGDVRIAVVLTPVSADAPPGPPGPVVPLDAWSMLGAPGE